MGNDKLKNIALKDIQIKDSFWNKYIDLVDDVILPYQWELINDRVEDAEKSYCIRNLRIAAKKKKGSMAGWSFRIQTLRNGWKP